MARRFFLYAAVFIFVAIPLDTHAARLYLSPSSGSYRVGDTISVRVLATSDASVNAVSAHLTYSSGVVTAQAASKAGSSLNFWVTEPTYSQSNGTVDMEGVALSGFQGSGMLIATLTFKAKKAGSATISFQTAQVLANDGQGTDITSGLGSATFDIDDSTQTTPPPQKIDKPEAPAPEEQVDTQGPFAITSSTHPDQHTWYPRKDGVFSWNVTSGVTATRILLDSKKNSKPTVLYDGALISKNITDLPQGDSYLHVQLKDGAGWGEVAHFAIHVDTVAPSISQFEEYGRSDKTDPQVRVYAKADDSASGVETFEFSIDGKNPVSFSDVSAGLYTLTVPSGLHTITLTAYDRARNASTRTLSVAVTPLAQPSITELPAEVSSGQDFTVSGEGVAGAKVTLYFVPRRIAKMTPLSALFSSSQVDQFTLEGLVGSDGHFKINSAKTPSADRFEVYAVLSDDRGATSLPSEPGSLLVSRPGYIVVGEYALSLLSLIAPLVALLALATVSVLWLLLWIRRYKKSLEEEVGDVDRVLSKAMALLKDDITDRMVDLKKKTPGKELRAAEEKMLAVIEEELKDTEKYIRKEVRDVKKLLSSKKGDAPAKKIKVTKEE